MGASMTRPRIGLTHNLPPELRPVPRGLAQPARATGYVAPGLFGFINRALRALLSKGSK